ncbi:ABC transporter ATP-binding protein/permease [uncultured Phascolarctobacterium sp.]|uniref:ABC transporter ATP-binding protein/permease n=1 Tax=uncultured Phascolarctobacterium sp. TaxID=512296 RepID=UPI0025FB0DE5|nr:ABC transporter ATP-binding protein/permease [uncultured Phascolarctobacterium sp.]
MQKFTLTRQFFKDVWYLTKSYWQSEEKKKAFWLLTCIIALTLGIVFMLVQLNTWNNSFYSALQNYDAEKISSELIHFSWLAAIYIILAVYSYYLQQTLILHWRRWLTTRFIDIWLQNKTYYNLQMFGKDTDNPDQRISEDVRQFVEMTLGFAIGILKSLCTFISFVFILYQLSGPLSFSFMGKTWTIHGYMLWASLLYSVLGTYVTHVVGRKLVKLNFIQQRYEADFRFSMIRLRESAESVAFYRGEAQEGRVFKNCFKLLLDNFWQLVNKQKQLVFLNSGYSQIAIIFPFVVAMNRYLSKEVSLGGLMQVASAFGRVQDSLSYFVDMYSSIAQWQAVVMRLTYFGRHMHEVSQQAEQFHVERFATSEAVSVEQMQVNLPDDTALLQDINFTLQPGRNVLIKGVSGSGKSTLLRALAGIWPFVTGKINLPKTEELMFIPQKPYIPLGSLREALLYPGNKPLSDEELLYLLDLCQIGYLRDKLDIVADWSHVLSVGEQQRLAFVRAHIQEPKWLFLDEATSALDEDTEAAMYTLLAERLRQTTLVSIGHRSTLNKYHELMLVIDKQTKSVRLTKN